MPNKSHALAAGVFVLTLLMLLAALAWWLTRDQSEYTVYELATTESISGLQPEAPVRYKGVNVGKVRRISFDAHASGWVLIELHVNAATPIAPTRTFAQLGYQGVTGIAHIQLDDADVWQAELPPGTSGLPRLPMRASPLSTLADQSSSMVARADLVLQQLGQTLNADNQRRLSTLLDSLNDTAQSITITMRGVDKNLNQINALAAPALEHLPALAAQAHSSLAALEAAASHTASAAARLQAEAGAMAQLEMAAGALSAAAAQLRADTLPAVTAAASEAAHAAQALRHTAETLSEQPQSLIWGSAPTPPGPGEAGWMPRAQP